MLIVRPISSPSRLSDVGSSFCRARIAGEVLVFRSTFSPVIANNIGIMRSLYLLEVRNRSKDIVFEAGRCHALTVDE